MAAKVNKKVTGIISEVPECPVCMEPFTPPIYQCKTGHSLCNSCTKTLQPPVCPLCREDMTQTRTLLLEELILKVQVNCPNTSSGCKYTMITRNVEDHLKECIFREMDCPLGVVFGKCSWSGYLKSTMDHFKERHPNNCNISQDSDVELEVNINEDDRHFYLTSIGKCLFTLTIKTDTLKKMAYWAVQHIGSEKVARQYVYEIHLMSKITDKRKTVFSEQCYNDEIKADEVFRLGKTPMIPLDALGHFIKDNKLSFRVFIKRMPPPQNPKNKNNEYKPANEGKPINANKPKATFKHGIHKKNKNAN